MATQLTRTTAGLILQEPFTSLAAYTAAAAFSVDSSQPTYLQFDPTGSFAAIPSSPDASGVRELQLYIEAGVWYLVYDAGDGTGGAGGPWRVQMATSADRGLTWTRLGPLDIAITGGGNLPHGYTGFLTKWGSTYYFYAVTATSATGDVPNVPYSGQLFSNTAIGTTGWTFVSNLPQAGGQGAADSGTDCSECVYFDGTIYHLYTSIRNSTAVYGVGHFTSTSAVGPFSTFIGMAVQAANSTYGYENPHVFQSPALGLYCMFLVKFSKTGLYFTNVFYTSVDLNTWMPAGNLDDVTIHPDILHAKSVTATAASLLCPAGGPSGVVQIDANGYIPSSYDYVSGSSFTADDHVGSFVTSEPAPTALTGALDTTIFNDPFTGYTVGPLSGQGGWSQIVSGALIQANVTGPGAVNAGTNNSFPCVNAGTSTADGIVSATANIANLASIGLWFRYTNATHSLLVLFEPQTVSNSVIAIYYDSGSGFVLLHTVGGLTFPTGNVVYSVKYVGNVYTVSVAGVVVSTYTDTTSLITAAGLCGFYPGGTPAVFSNFNVQSINPAGRCRRALALTNTFQAEFAIAFDISSGAGSMGFDFLVQDASNYYRLLIAQGGKCSIQKYVAGTPTTLTNAATPVQVTTPGFISYVRITCVAGVMSVLLDGEVQVTATDTTFTSGTIIGFYFDGSATYRVRSLNVCKGGTVTINGATNGNTLALRGPGANGCNLPATTAVVSGGGQGVLTWPHYPMALVSDVTGAIDYAPSDGSYMWGGDVFGPVLAPGTITAGTITTTTIAATATDATGGAGGYTYQWSRRLAGSGGYTNVAGQTTLNLADTGLTPGTAYDYRLTYTDSASATAQAFLLNISTAGTSLAAGAITETGSAQTTLSFTATNATGGAGGYSYQWSYRLHGVGGYVNTGTNSLALALTGLTASTAYDVQLTYTDAAFNVVSAFLLNVITPFAVLTAGVITLVTPTASTLSFTATDATGGTPPITVHQWAYRPAGIGTYIVFSSGALNSLLTGLSPSTAYDIELIYHDSAAGVVTAFLLDVSTLASPPLVPINYTINSTSSMQWLQVGDNLPCSCNFTGALLATGAPTPFTVSTATVTVYDAALKTPVTGYTAISANVIGSPGTLVSVDVLLNCDPNISSPPALAVGQYNVEFKVVDSNGLEAVCSVLVQVTELVG